MRQRNGCEGEEGREKKRYKEWGDQRVSRVFLSPVLKVYGNVHSGCRLYSENGSLQVVWTNVGVSVVLVQVLGRR